MKTIMVSLIIMTLSHQWFATQISGSSAFEESLSEATATIQSNKSQNQSEFDFKEIANAANMIAPFITIFAAGIALYAVFLTRRSYCDAIKMHNENIFREEKERAVRGKEKFLQAVASALLVHFTSGTFHDKRETQAYKANPEAIHVFLEQNIYQLDKDAVEKALQDTWQFGCTLDELKKIQAEVKEYYFQNQITK